MPVDEDYFSRDRSFLDQIRKDVSEIHTLSNLKHKAILYRWRGGGPILAEKIDRLTNRKVKADGSRDGRWIWQNIQALQGRRVAVDAIITVHLACALQSLIVHEYESGEFWGLKRDWRNKLVFGKKPKPGDAARSALDVLTILIEQKKETEKKQRSETLPK